MNTETDEIIYRYMEWDTQTNIRSENRAAALSLSLPQEVLLRILVTPTSSLAIQKRASRYFTDLAETHFDEVFRYLRAFFLRLAETCDTSSPGLLVTTDGRQSEFDFPRPSPSWMMVDEFCKGLRRHQLLYEQLKAMPVRWFNGR